MNWARSLRFQTFFGILLALSIGACSRPDTAVAKESPATVRDIGLATVSKTGEARWFEATGVVKARLNATLSSKVMSRVMSVNVKEGDRVHAGQVLVSLDPRELRSAVQMAGANLYAANVGIGNASTAATIEERTSAARISQAQEAVNQARSAVRGAQFRLDLALAGPRTQERTQAKLAVQLAESNLRLAQTERDRVSRLVEAGALAGKLLDSAQNALDVAKAQFDSAVESEKISQEGTRSEEIQTAREGVAQARAAMRQAEANLKQARAAALQTQVRRQDIRAAQAQAVQASAALGSARVTLSYATVVAPFDGVVVSRLVDPGAMAAPGVPLLAIEGGGLRLDATIPENVLAHIRLGTLARVRLDALGRDLQAKVTEMAPQGDVSTHSYIVKLTLPNDGGLNSGMFGRAKFVTGGQTRLMVPSNAVWEREGLRYVYVVNPEGIARLRIVTIGETDGDRLEVLSGLAEGDRIVTKGRERVIDGAKVQP